MGSDAPSPNTPLVLIGRDDRKLVVKSVDRAAIRSGIRLGMAATQARAMIADLHIEDADPDGDATSLEQLAYWAVKHYSPIVAVDELHGLYIDASGAAHLFGGEHAMLTDLTTRLKSVGITSRAAMASSYGAAHALARFKARPILVIEDHQREAALAELPVTALRLQTSTIEGLHALGFDTIGELVKTPRAPLALRFGSELGRRLDQAYGRTQEPIEPIIVPDLISVKQIFAEPVGTPEALSHFIGKLVEALCLKLESQAVGTRRLDLLFHRVDNTIQSMSIGLAKPVRDLKRLSKLLCAKLETINPGFGVEVMALSSPWIEPLTYLQTATQLGEAPRADVSSLIDTLSNRLGSSRLYQISAVETDVPERSMKRVAPLSAMPKTEWPKRWPRPPRLLYRPEPIETIALLPDNPPVSFTWRGVRRRVRCADGPERIFGEWWKRDSELDAVRDYFQVEDDSGERYWMYRAGDGVDEKTGSHRWYLHGIFA